MAVPAALQGPDPWSLGTATASLCQFRLPLSQPDTIRCHSEEPPSHLWQTRDSRRPMEGSGGNARFFPFAGLLGVGVCLLPRTCGTAVWTPLEDVHWSPATGLSAVSSGATRPRVFLPVLGRQERALKSHSAGVGGDTGRPPGVPARAPGGGGAALFCSSGVQ